MANFSGRSLDIDVICDLMIHDLDLVLQWVGAEVSAINAVGVPVLSGQMDMASARIEFENGAVANLTASRVSFTPQRRMRLFTPARYLRLDFVDRSVECIERSTGPDGTISIEPRAVKVPTDEPLRRELESFAADARFGRPPRVGGGRALRALELANQIRTQAEERARKWEATMIQQEMS